MDDRKPYAALIDQLVEDGRPVRRLWSPAARLAVWLGLLAVAVGGLVLRFGWPFAAGAARAPSLAWEVLAAAVVAGLWAALALRAAVPGREPPRAAIVAAGSLTLTPALFWLDRQSAQLDASVSTFINTGVPCAVVTVVFSLLACAPLLWAVRRGAPLAPQRAAALVGGAGFLTGYLLMRFFCSVDDPAHLLAWHALPVPIGAAATAARSGWLLARWRHGPGHA